MANKVDTYKKIVTWVQDVRIEDSGKTVFKFNVEYIKRPKDSKYIIGLSKNNKTGYVGIYFEDNVIAQE